ncbi:MAG: tetraacyldisaccharide 4'-kinase [bacterium]
MKWLTAPISLLFAAVSYLRWKMYKWGIFLHTKKAPAPVISIGNIALGGTGKTPCTIWLARELKSRGYDPVILTRGYKRSIKERLYILGNIPEARLAGDEPALIASHLSNIPIVVHRDRVESAKEIGGENGRIFILDDGFQHLKIHKDVNIVLFPADHPLSGGSFFPKGNLRDGKWRIDEADIIILVGGIEEMPVEFNHLKDRIFNAKKIPTGLFTLDNVHIPWSAIEGKKVVAFSAIGSPASFNKTLTKVGAEVTAHKSYKDHHHFTVNDINDIENLAEAHGADILITTEKDAIRLAGLQSRITTYYIKIGFKPDNPDEIIAKTIELITKEA